MPHALRPASCLLLLLLVLAPAAYSSTYFVAPGGNDGNSCGAATNSTTPRQHIANGISCLSGGDTLVIKNGTYAEVMDDGSIPSGPDAAHPTIIRAENRLGAILLPGGSLGGGTRNLLALNGKSFVTVDGLILDANGASPGLNNLVIVRPPSSGITLQYNEIRNLAAIDYGSGGGTGIDMEDGVTNAWVHHNEVHHIAYGFNDNHVHGFYISSQASVYEYNHIHHYQAYGIQMFTTESDASGNIYRGNLLHDSFTRAGIYVASANNTLVVNNVIYTQPAQGIRMGPECAFGCDNNQVYNNTVYSTSSACIEVNGNQSNAKVRNNICWSTGGDISDAGSGTSQSNNLTGTDPLFVNSGAGDFHLQSGSPARDKPGTCLGAVPLDADQIARPQPAGGNCDQGAYEFASGAPPEPPSDNPIAWWKLDEGSGTTAGDATGNGNTLTLTAGPTWHPGRVGPKSLHCDGAGGYADDATPFATGTNQYTWTGWVKGDGAPTTTNEHVLMNGLDSETWGLSWGHGDAAFRQAWQHRDAGGNYYAAKLTTTLVGGLWYHIAASYDGTSVRVYLNGQLQATTAAPSMIAAAGHFTLCGAGAVTPWAGNLDQVKIWNRKISDAEVLGEYGRSAGVTKHKTVAR